MLHFREDASVCCEHSVLNIKEGPGNKETAKWAE